jgi:hypothetical protein
MDLHDQRMQCLKMAFELGGKPDAVLTAAQQLLDFVTGPNQPDVADAAGLLIDQAPGTAPIDAVPDPIAACGTALLLPEGGELADAMPTADVSVIAAESVAAALEATGELASSDADAEAPQVADSLSEPSAAATEPEELEAAIESAGETSAEVATIETPTPEAASESSDVMSAAASDANGAAEAAPSIN